MASERARRRAPPFIDPPGYARHRPEATLLYQLVERHYPEFVAAREAAGRPLPKYVQEEFEAYLKCGRLEHGFLRVPERDQLSLLLLGARDAGHHRASQRVPHGGQRDTCLLSCILLADTQLRDDGIHLL
jgi:hypothetical protein